MLACNNSNRETEPLVQSKVSIIDIDTSSRFVKFSDLFSMDSIILLRNGRSPIIKIEKLVSSDKYFYLFDKKYSKTIYIYSLKGDYVNEIKGLKITDFCIDDKNLYVYTASTKSIRVYSENAMQLKTEISISGAFHTLEVFNRNLIFFRDGGQLENSKKDLYGFNRICQFDLNGKYIKGWFNYPLAKVNSGQISSYKVKDTLFISRLYSDTIFSLSKKFELSACYKVLFNGIEFSRNILNTTDQNQFSQQIFLANYIAGPVYKENSFMSFIYRQGDYFRFFLKNQQEQRSISGIINDRNDLPVILPFSEIKNNKAVSILPYENLLELQNMQQNSGLLKQDGKLHKLIEDAKETQNPSLLITRFK
jgi:hypothetical protein